MAGWYGDRGSLEGLHWVLYVKLDDKMPKTYVLEAEVASGIEKKKIKTQYFLSENENRSQKVKNTNFGQTAPKTGTF